MPVTDYSTGQLRKKKNKLFFPEMATTCTGAFQRMEDKNKIYFFVIIFLCYTNIISEQK